MVPELPVAEVEVVEDVVLACFHPYVDDRVYVSLGGRVSLICFVDSFCKILYTSKSTVIQ